MRAYEAIFVMKPNLEKEAMEELIEKVKKLIQDSQGEVLSVDDWGKRKLAYTVQGFNDGFYVLIKFKGSPELPGKLERMFRLTEIVIKHMITKLENKQPDKKQQGEVEDKTENEIEAQA